MHDPKPDPNEADDLASTERELRRLTDDDVSALKRRVEDRWNGKLSEAELAKRQRQIRRSKANANRRPGKGKSALKQAAALQEIRRVALNEEQIAEMRRQNAPCDLAIAQATGSPPGSMTVWSAHAERSSLVMIVAVPQADEQGETEIHVDYFDGGTEWDRKQAIRKAIGEVMERGKELGYGVSKL